MKQKKYIRRFIDNRFRLISIIYRKIRDKFIYFKSLTILNDFEYGGNNFKFHGKSLKKQFENRRESGELGAIKSLFQSKFFDTFIDIGANQGLFTLLALKERNIKNVISVEPEQDNYSLLLRNIKINNDLYVNKIIALKLGISNQNSINELWGGLEGGSFVKGWGGITSTYSDKVQIISLDLLTQLLVSGSNPLIKIDTEGFEENVIKGAIKTLNNQRASFIIEVSLFENKEKIDSQKYLDLFNFMFSKNFCAFSFPRFQPINLSILNYWLSSFENKNQNIFNKEKKFEYSQNIFFTPNNSLLKVDQI